MPNRDYYNPNKVVQALASQNLAATGSGTVAVRVGDACLITANVGAASTAGGACTTANRWDLVVTECATSTGTFTAVSATELINSIAATTIGAFASLTTLAKLSSQYSASYVGKQPFIKVQATKVASAPKIYFGANVVLGDLAYAPNP